MQDFISTLTNTVIKSFNINQILYFLESQNNPIFLSKYKSG